MHADKGKDSTEEACDACNLCAETAIAYNAILVNFIQASTMMYSCKSSVKK